MRIFGEITKIRILSVMPMGRGALPAAADEKWQDEGGEWYEQTVHASDCTESVHSYGGKLYRMF